MKSAAETRAGVVYATAAFSIWCLSPIYWKLVHEVPTIQLLVHRVAWSLPCLLLFTEGARRLRLSTVGLLQYLAPTGQFLLAFLVYGEELGVGKLISFVLIWIGLLIYSIEARRAARVAARYDLDGDQGRA